MPRSDLLIGLVKTGTSGDTESFRKSVEILIADERAKKHEALADRLAAALEKNGAPYSAPLDGGAVYDLCVDLTPSRPLDDLILPENVAGVCREIVEEHRRREFLGSHGLKPRNRILLVGPSGNGKTAMAAALAFELKAPLIVARYDGLVARGFAGIVPRLKRLCDHACGRGGVVFFDDFDVVGKERGDEHESEVKRVIGALLLGADDLSAQVVVVAATHRPELLDRALRRRFQIRLELPPPTVEQTVEFFEKAAARVEVPFGYTPRMIAQMLQGASYAELDDFVSDVARRYVLSLPKSDEKKIIAQCLDQWKKRFKS